MNVDRETIESCVEMVKDGYSVKEAAERYNVTQKMISYECKIRGISPRKKTSKVERTEMMRAFGLMMAGFRFSRIGKIEGVPIDVIEKRITRAQKAIKNGNVDLLLDSERFAIKVLKTMRERNNEKTTRRNRSNP